MATLLRKTGHVGTVPVSYNVIIMPLVFTGIPEVEDYLLFRLHTHTHTHTHTYTYTHTQTPALNDCSRNWVLILVRMEIVGGRGLFSVWL